MSKEHFNTGSGEGKHQGGIIPPATGPEPDVAPLRRDSSAAVLGVKYNKPKQDGGGVVAEETLDETRGARSGPRVKKEKQPTRVPTGASTPRGYAEGARPATKAVASALSGHIGTYKTLLNTAASIKSLSAEHAGAVDTARYHISQAERSHGLAHTEGMLGSKTQNRDVAHGHLQDAADHLSSAHEVVMTSGVHKEMAKHHLNGEVPSDERVSGVVSSAYQLDRVGVKGVAGAKKPHKVVKFGKADLPGAAIDKEFIDRAVEVGGEANTSVAKLKAGQGTPRDPQRRAKAKAALDALNTELVTKGGKKLDKLPTNVGGMISGIDKSADVNPMRRGRATRIDSKFSSGANKRGRTPKFEG